MDADSGDPRVVDLLVVTAEDVVSALEARRQRGRPVVLRVTPPFSGRMRARLHVADGDPPVTTEGARPLHVDPGAFVADDAPAYPRPADTEDALRADPSVEYTVERHHERHEAAVADWRERVRDHFVDRTTVDSDRGPVAVEVSVLG